MRTKKLTVEAFEDFYQSVVRPFDQFARSPTLDGLEKLCVAIVEWRKRCGLKGNFEIAGLAALRDKLAHPPVERSEFRMKLYSDTVSHFTNEVGQAINKIFHTRNPNKVNVRNKIQPFKIYAVRNVRNDDGSYRLLTEDEVWASVAEDLEKQNKL